MGSYPHSGALAPIMFFGNDTRGNEISLCPKPHVRKPPNYIIILCNQAIGLFNGGNWWRRYYNSMLPCLIHLVFLVFCSCFVTHAIHNLHLDGWCNFASNPCTSSYAFFLLATTWTFSLVNRRDITLLSSTIQTNKFYIISLAKKSSPKHHNHPRPLWRTCNMRLWDGHLKLKILELCITNICIFTILSKSQFMMFSMPLAMETSPFAFMLISKEYPSHFFHLNVYKVAPPLQVDSSKTCTIPFWKGTMFIPNKSFTCFQAHELMLLSFYITT